MCESYLRSVAPRVCAALDKCVMNGLDELRAFPQVDSPPFKFREDSELRVRGAGVSTLKGFCHVDSYQIVRTVGCVGLWSLFVRERRSGVWRRLVQGAAQLLCSVLCGTGDGTRVGDGRSASAGRTEGHNGGSAALSERLPSRPEHDAFASTRQANAELVGPIPRRSQVLWPVVKSVWRAAGSVGQVIDCRGAGSWLGCSPSAGDKNDA